MILHKQNISKPCRKFRDSSVEAGNVWCKITPQISRVFCLWIISHIRTRRASGEKKLSKFSTWKPLNKISSPTVSLAMRIASSLKTRWWYESEWLFSISDIKFPQLLLRVIGDDGENWSKDFLLSDGHFIVHLIRFIVGTPNTCETRRSMKFDVDVQTTNRQELWPPANRIYLFWSSAIDIAIKRSLWECPQNTPSTVASFSKWSSWCTVGVFCTQQRLQNLAIWGKKHLYKSRVEDIRKNMKKHLVVVL